MRVLDLYITKVCNLNCDYCYVDIQKNETSKFSLQGLERINLLNYDSIKFFWWEPLLKWKLITEIITIVRAKKVHPQFTIVTNWILLSQDKVDYALENNIHFVVSIHQWGRQKIVSHIPHLRRLQNQLWFYIIFAPDDISVSLRDFLYFTKQGFKNFSFAPEIYADWNNENIKKLKKVLDILFPYIKKHSLHISGISWKSLKILNRACEKTVLDETWNYSPCNRFKKVNEGAPFSYKEAYDSFNDIIGYDSDPERWFYICPVWWFLDHKDSWKIDTKIHEFYELNQLFLDFFRRLNAEKINYLTPGIHHYRFNLTRQCNIRCSYCYVDFTNETLAFDVWKNIIDFFLEQEWNHKTISFFWWEPLLEFELLQKLVFYSLDYAHRLNKKVSFCIATNFMLVHEKSIHFLHEHNVKIHISINGKKEKNDLQRDNSSDIVLNKIKKFLSPTQRSQICILFAFWPDDIDDLYDNIIYLIHQWFIVYNFELIFWKSYHWDTNKVIQSVKEIKKISMKYPHLDIVNFHPKDTFLDIDTLWQCSDNSLEFYDTKIDREASILFKNILQNL